MEEIFPCQELASTEKEGKNENGRVASPEKTHSNLINKPLNAEK